MIPKFLDFKVNLNTILLLIIAVGVWVIVGKLNIGTQDVRVVNTVDVEVDNRVAVEGWVEVSNTVDVNLDKVLGYPVGCRESYTIDGQKYHSIDVCDRSRW